MSNALSIGVAGRDAASADRRAAGQPIDVFDALVAATTAAGFPRATRDAGGFESYGLDIINLWQG